jgi:hypothetical protein
MRVWKAFFPWTGLSMASVPTWLTLLGFFFAAVGCGDQAQSITGLADAGIQADEDGQTEGSDANAADVAIQETDGQDVPQIDGEADAADSAEEVTVTVDTTDADADDADASPDTDVVLPGCATANCDDGNPCTIDSCTPSQGCDHVELPACVSIAAACITNADCPIGVCNSAHACVACVVPSDCGAGSWLCESSVCKPSTACISDVTCKAANQVCISGVCQECGKSSDCGIGQTCEGGHCVTPVPCTSSKTCPGVCDLATGQCVGCKSDSDCPVSSYCDSSKTCVPDVCNATSCVGSNVATCNGNGSGFVVNSCDDGDLCTDDNCVPGAGCAHTPNSVVCDDGDACTSNDVCAGTCTGTVILCDDGNVCTADSCAPAVGCVFLATAATCSDDSVCTLADACSGTTCLPGPLTSCDDENACTGDACLPASGCTHTSLDDTPCDDGNACTVGTICGASVCAGGSVKTCDDASVCTQDSCVPATGCLFTAAAGPCDDGSVCTSGDTCGGGNCLPGAATNCDDEDACSSDVCDPVMGCQHKPLSATPCDDAVFCTVNDHCASGTCVGDANLCSDDDVCTDDTCAGASCHHAPNAVPCADGNACTNDSCDPKSGCVYLANSLTCTDGNPCTVSDTCSAGTCAGVAKGCDDSNACTTDSCDGASGNCLHVAVTDGTSCDADGSVCTPYDSCKTGVCKLAAKINCNDANACTTDSCDPKTGCGHLAVADGLACSGGVCETGTCTTCPANTVRIAIDDAGVAKAVCALDYPAWGIEGLSPDSLTDKGDGTVSDGLTGLIWRQAVDLNIKEDNSPSFCDTLVFAGKSDWRLPTVAEYFAIVDYAGPNLFNPSLFPSTPTSGDTWTIVEDTSGYMRWFVDLSNGTMATWPYDAGTVRCVRGVEDLYLPPQRFTVSGSGSTVKDNATGLIWQRTPPSGTYSTGDGKTYCAALNLDSLTNWHLPDVRELISITDRSNFTQSAIDAVAFPDTPAEFFWTTTPRGSSQYAVNFGKPGWNNAYGNLSLPGSGDKYRVRCVHNGN